MPSPVEIVQTVSNIIYLLLAWGFFIALVPRYLAMSPARQRISIWAAAACFLLAFGDSFHLVPRLVDVISRLFQQPVAVDWWIGFGLAVSSVTLTFFYFFLTLYAWRKFALRWTFWMWVLVAACLVRLLLLGFPQNMWGSDVYTPWKFYRNLPFLVQGIGAVALFWSNSPTKLVRGIGWSIIVSFVCYLLTLIGTLWSPLWGMFMLPKSAAYVILVWLLFRFEYSAVEQSQNENSVLRAN